MLEADPYVTLGPSDINQSIGQRFISQVNKHKCRRAICSAHYNWSYQELGHEVAKIAQALSSLQQEGQVAILLEHDAPMIAAMLAALNVGLMYIPLDPNYPAERLNYIIEDSEAQTIITDEAHLSLINSLKLPEHINILNLHDIKHAAQLKEFLVTPEHHAYMIYTSGTTGKPKGVYQNHRNTLHFWRVYSNALQITSQDRLSNVASFCFDAAIMDIYGALLNGAELHLLNLKEFDFDKSMQWFAHSAITLFHSTPTVFRFMMRHAVSQSLKSLRAVVLGGEKASKEDFDLFKEHCSEACKLINGFGPTESTISLQYHMNKQSQINFLNLPIGYPVHETHAFLVDENGQETTAEGEMIVQSPYLALGYWRNPQLTQEAFIDLKNVRAYRTGDIAKISPEGLFEFMGRRDNQVKIRGFRVELGEIEQCLMKHSKVKHAVVSLNGDSSRENQQLLAYVIPHKDLENKELHDHARKFLPDYMVPAAFIPIEKIPLKPNGKIDYETLNKIEIAQEGTAIPSDAIAIKLADKWQNLMGKRPNYLEDDFFALGGHSLLAIQLIAWIKREFALTLPLKVFFSQSTFKGILEAVTTLKNNETSKIIAPKLVKLPRNQPLPLSFGQQRLWFIEKLLPRPSTYNIPIVLHCKGKIDVPALRFAIDAISQRHEILRTTYEEVEGVGIQVIHDTSLFTLEKILLEHGNNIKKIEEEAFKSFNLNQGPLLKVVIFEVNSKESYLLFNFHHISADWWSMGIFLKELEYFYNAQPNQSDAKLPALPVQYADFSVWQKQYKNSKSIQEKLGYWQKQLSDLPAPLQLLPAKSRLPLAEQEGSAFNFTLPMELSSKLKEFAQAHNATLFMVLIAAFNTLLFRYSQQKDIIIGTPVANRNPEEIENLIGCFINVVPIRSRFHEKLNFIEFLQQVRETTLTALMHQEVPFEQIVDHLKIERDISIHPIFQVLFVLQNAPVFPPKLGSVTTELVTIDEYSTKYDLALTLLETPQGLKCIWEYMTDIFSLTAIKGLACHYQGLLENILATPHKRLTQLEYLNASEKMALTSVIEYKPPRKITHLAQMFESTAARFPQAIAVIAGDEEITYAQLESHANQLAQHLIDINIKPGDFVAICLDKSILTVISVLAVLKTGAAYIPIDPKYPLDRINYMLANSQAKLTISDGNFTPEWFAKNKANPKISSYHFLSHSPAYLIYTSGSTGKPKASLITHDNLLNAFEAWQNAYHLKQQPKILQMASFSFDVFASDLLIAFGLGGTLVLCPQSYLLEPAKLFDCINRHQINYAEFVPAVLRLLLSYLEENQLKISTLDILNCGSDSWSHNEYVRARAVCAASARIINTYGLTETSITNMYYEDVAKELILQAQDTPLPLGKSFVNMGAFILDNNLQPLPQEVAGELYLSGRSVGQGYFNLPSLTAERFVPNPYANGRLYKTGDRARILADGNIEFLGRLDFQAKIRGFRIEIGEIEASLRNCPQIKEAVVIIQEESLIAYVVGNQSSESLQNYLRELLPSYMVPDHYIFMHKLPLTPNGKVDRNALPKIEILQVPQTSTSTSMPIAAIILGIWREILHKAEINLSDNFFKVGGHSLLAVQVIARIRKSFNVDIPVIKLFEYPTIIGLSLVVKEISQNENAIHLPPLMPQASPQQLSFAQQRLWFLHELEPDSAIYNLSFGYKLKGHVDVARLRKSLDKICERQLSLRTAYRTSSAGQAEVFILPEARFKIMVENFSSLPYEQALANAFSFINKGTGKPFNLNQNELIRVIIIEISHQETLLFVEIPHINFDGGSQDIFIQELFQIYAGNELAPLTLQYMDYAAWQRGWLNDSVLNKQLDFWYQELKDSSFILNLPTDFNRPPIQSYKGEQLSFEIPAELAKRIGEFSQKESATLYMTLLATFGILLHVYSAQDDILIGTPATNRNQVELENIIGLFINTLVIRSVLTREDNFKTLLMKIKNRVIQAYFNADLPFEKLVDHLAVERNLSRNPVFQVLFSLEHAKPIKNSANLIIEEFENPVTNSKFDLSLYLQESSGSIKGYWEYSTDLFTPETIQQLSKQFIELLQRVILTPEKRLSEISILSDNERQKIIFDWNVRNASYPRQKTLVNLFEEQVNKAPDNIAVIFEGNTLTYSQLNKRANKLAHYLQKQEVGPETLVAICMERSLELLVGLLGILKAGAGYVPVDPAYPQERKNYILQNSKANILVDTSTLVACETESTSNVGISILPQGLAYVIYTSGSTGDPKGVAITHQNASAFIHWAQSVFDISVLKCVLAGTSICFDLSIFEIFLPLSRGGKIILTRNPLNVDEWINAGVTLINTVPSVMEALVLQKSIPKSVRVVNVAGEPISATLVDKIYSEGIEKLYNLYGPTEDTTYSTFALLKAKENVTIGKPISNSQAYILDRNLQPVPIGVKGILYLGGEGLARGYLNRAELTAERFIPNPFTEGRLYKTGDLCRYLADGRIEYIGREDFQVKIRGFRIELGEIEAALKTCEGIKDAVVIVREDKPGIKQLVAYYVAKPMEDLREQLIQKLPEHMIPSLFVSLEKLPYTPNGKLDRKALPEPSALSQAEIYVSPRNEIEKDLWVIWQEVLKQTGISVKDNFFSLGGDSILSIQIISRAREQGYQIKARDMFQYPTIESLARVAKREKAQHLNKQTTGIVPLGPIQQWFFEQRFAVPNHFNQAMVFNVPADCNGGAILSQVFAKHPALFMRYEGQKQFYAAIKSVKVPEFSLDQMSVQAEVLQASLDIEQGTMFKAALFKGEDEAKLFIVIHHLVIDGVSWRILLDDIEAAIAGKAIIDEKASYKDWVLALQEYVAAGHLAKDQSYWLNQPQAQPLRVDVIEEGAGSAELSLRLSAEETYQLLRDVPLAYRTQINDILLTALVLAIKAWQGLDAVDIHLEGHGREDLGLNIDISRTVGWFTSLFPVHLALPSSDDLGEIIKAIKEQLRAVPHKGISYGILRYLSAEEVRESLKTKDQPEIVFNYLGQLSGFSSEATGVASSEKNEGAALIEMNSQILGECLQVDIGYKRSHYREESIKQLAEYYQASLRKLISYCMDDQHADFTASDFPLLAKPLNFNLRKLFPDAASLREVQANIEDIYPQTPMQKEIYMHATQYPASQEYITQLVFELNGEVDKVTLKQAWQMIVENYEIYRTGFCRANKNFLQVVFKTAVIEWVDSESFETHSRHELNQNFNLFQPPLMRIQFIKLSTNKHLMIYTQHHLLLDGWSITLVINKLWDFYLNLMKNETVIPALNTNRIKSYMEWLQQQDKSKAMRFWSKQLSEFPKIKFRQIPSRDHDVINRAISGDLYQKIKQFSKSNQLTTSCILQGIWGLTLTSSKCLTTFGSLVSGRNIDLKNINKMVGLFINIIPMLAHKKNEGSYLNYIKSFNHQFQQAQQYAYLDMAEFKKCANLADDEVLFNQVFKYQNYPQEKEENSLVPQSVIIEYKDHFHYELVISATEEDNQIQLEFDYLPETYPKETIREFIEKYIQLLGLAVTDKEPITGGDIQVNQKVILLTQS